MKKETFKGYTKPTALEMLRESVKASGKSQKEFAESHSLDPATLSSVLKGYRPIPSNMLSIIGLEMVAIFVPAESTEVATG